MIHYLHPIVIGLTVLIAPVTGFTASPEISGSSDPGFAERDTPVARTGFQPGNFGAPSSRVGGGTRSPLETSEEKQETSETPDGSKKEAPSYPTSKTDQPLKY